MSPLLPSILQQSTSITPTAARGAGPPTSVDLTTWFLDAKRSLSSVALCARANELVDSTRVALQEATVISSRCVFLRNALQDQLLVAVQINRMMHTAREASKTEFERILVKLDDADDRLNKTLEILRNSIVDSAFSTPNPESGDRALMTKARTLHDFVDDEGIENVRSRLRHSIDQVQESHDTLLMSLSAFDNELLALRASLSGLPESNTQTFLNMSEPIQPYLQTLEEHAEAMAQLLESLTKHFDRCSEALQHSEAASTRNQETGMADSMPPGAKADLYAVLEGDAKEVDGVVAELEVRLRHMELTSSRVVKHVEDLHMLSNDVQGTFSRFERFRDNLGNYIERTREFEMQQDGYVGAMEERLDELGQLGDFYQGFMGAYDAMVIEVGRRKGVTARMEAILGDAMKKLQGLYEDDLAEREAFKEEQGDHLPVDIWAGVMDPPVRYSIVKDTRGSELPGINKEAIQKALDRQRMKEGL